MSDLSRRHALRFLSGAFIGPAMGAPRHMPTYGPAPSSKAWSDFIVNNPSFWSWQAGTAKASPALFRALEGAMVAVPNSCYRPDPKGRDVWKVTNPYGDCEDLALRRLEWLTYHGVIQTTMRMTICRLPDGRGHCVLTVVTDDGDWILDTLADRPRLWREASYQWVARLRRMNDWDRLAP